MLVRMQCPLLLHKAPGKRILSLAVFFPSAYKLVYRLSTLYNYTTYDVGLFSLCFTSTPHGWDLVFYRHSDMHV